MPILFTKIISRRQKSPLARKELNYYLSLSFHKNRTKACTSHTHLSHAFVLFLFTILHKAGIRIRRKNKQGGSNSEVIICFGTKFKLSVELIQLLKVVTVLGFTLRHCHNCLWFSKSMSNK